MSTIGERIAQLRARRGMTQGELGEAIGETKQTIYKYEHGIVTNIPLPKIEAIAAVLRCPPAILTGWETPAEPEAPAEEEIPEVTLLARAGRKMSPERRKDMIALLKIAFPEEFGDEK